MDTIYDTIIKISHTYFEREVVSPQGISNFINKTRLLYPDIEIDEDWLFRKLESIHDVVIGVPDFIDSGADHVEWFNPSANTPIHREFEWHFWDHFKQYMITKKGWPSIIINSIDNLSSEILSRLEDPCREGFWDRRGMVMGSVQSGKTANYSALITKAADAGYKLFLVLAGVHNSLRSQTQTRLNDEFLGYDIERVQQLTGAEQAIGVRALFRDHKPVYSLTSSAEKGDFQKSIASRSGIPLSKDGPPIILVIKKNVTILRNLISWVPSIVGETGPNGLVHIPEIPVLVIDDECDYASINTTWPERDEEGRIIEEWNPTSTNRLIRELLRIFDKSAYIGYTATPYANIFIHRDEETHPIYGEDLFPRSFIISLPVPSNYLGPERVFGFDSDPDRDIESVDPLPLIRVVSDHEDIIPDKHKKDLNITSMPDSMEYAMKSFLLSCAARSLRKEGTPHNSMLIHVTRFTHVQDLLYDLITVKLRDLMSRIMSGEALNDFRVIWETDFIVTTKGMAESIQPFHDAITHPWVEIEKVLADTTRHVKVKKINGTSRDYLDYREAELQGAARVKSGEVVSWQERGLSTIVIGGDKLSRGLTLEGLSVSYYLRATKMYDTLMQMGRWFGYRDGYSDLCRIYTTGELLSWYRHIAAATQELREEINYMSSIKKTPEEFGLKVRSHPGRLVVTSAGKRRNSERILLSYEGQIPETISYDRHYTIYNYNALKRMVREIKHTNGVDHRQTSAGQLWFNVTPVVVINFLNNYQQREDAMRTVKASVIAKYIEMQNNNGELSDWCVAMISKTNAEETIAVDDYQIGCVKRKPFPAGSLSESSVTIKRLVNPSDEALDLSDEEIEKAREYDRIQDSTKEGGFRPSGTTIRRYIRPKERGLLLIYLIHGEDSDGKRYGGPKDPVVGFAVSFPGSSTAKPIEYLVNTVYAYEDLG